MGVKVKHILIVLGFLLMVAGVQAQQLQVGGEAVVYVEDPTGLRVRSAPGIRNTALTNLFTGDIVTIIGGPANADGYVWWNIRTRDGIEGWSVEFADGIQTLTPLSPTPTPLPTSTIMPQLTTTPMPIMPQVNTTTTPSPTQSIYNAVVDGTLFEASPFLAIPLRGQIVYNLVWSPSLAQVAIADTSGSVAFPIIFNYLDDLYGEWDPEFTTPVLINGPLAEQIRFSVGYPFAEISGPSDPSNLDSQKVRMIYDYMIYQVGGTRNDRPLAMEGLPDNIEWITPPIFRVVSACDAPDDLPIITDEQGTLQAGNPAQFTYPEGDILFLGDGSGGIAWGPGNAHVLLWSSVDTTPSAIDQLTATGTAEVWNIQTGELLLTVPHAAPYESDCGTEARPAALGLEADGIQLATIIQTAIGNYALLWEVASLD